MTPSDGAVFYFAVLCPGTHRQSIIEAPLGAECPNPKQGGKGPAVKLMSGCLRRKPTGENQISKRVVNPCKIANMEV